MYLCAECHRSPLTNIAMSKIDTGNDFNVPKMESSVSHKTSFENILLNEINIVRSSPYEYSNKLQKPCERIKKENNTYFFVYSEQEKIILQKGLQHLMIRLRCYAQFIRCVNYSGIMSLR